jgi:hypothetical protein
MQHDSQIVKYIGRVKIGLAMVVGVIARVFVVRVCEVIAY